MSRGTGVLATAAAAGWLLAAVMAVMLRRRSGQLSALGRRSMLLSRRVVRMRRDVDALGRALDGRCPPALPRPADTVPIGPAREQLPSGAVDETVWTSLAAGVDPPPGAG